MCFAGAGNLQVLERLLVMGESIFRADINSWTPLMWAAAGGHVAVIQRLLVGGAALGICDKHGQGVLHVCAAKGHLEAVSTLVDALAAQKLDLHSPVCLGLLLDIDVLLQVDLKHIRAIA